MTMVCPSFTDRVVSALRLEKIGDGMPSMNLSESSLTSWDPSMRTSPFSLMCGVTVSRMPVLRYCTFCCVVSTDEVVSSFWVWDVTTGTSDR
jgi:hypothetical protein